MRALYKTIQVCSENESIFIIPEIEKCCGIVFHVGHIGKILVSYVKLLKIEIKVHMTDTLSTLLRGAKDICIFTVIRTNIKFT